MVLLLLAPLHAAQPHSAAPGSNEDKLIKAVKDRDLQKVQELLEAEADVNAFDGRSGRTPLYLAAFNGDVEMALLLLGAGANVNAAETFGIRLSALDAAITYDRLEMVKTLLNHGAYVNRFVEGETPLMLAVRVGNLQIVQELLDHGADVNAVDEFGGRTALEIAQELNKNEIVNRLRRAGAGAGVSSAQLTQATASNPFTSAPAPAKGFTRRQKGLALATLTAVVVGTVGIKLRTYQRTKKILAKKYKLGNLTKLQDTIWLATLLASYRMPWRLHALVRNNPGSLESLVGKDPQALAELYYGHTPSQAELDTFIQKFFAGIE